MPIPPIPTFPVPAGRRRRACCVDEACDTGLRNEYFEGKRLTADSFRVEQAYTLERRHLLNRALHGWGVVYGYAVTHGRPGAGQAGEGTLHIGAGLALDASGRELLHSATTLQFDDVILLGDKLERLERPPEGSFEARAVPVVEGRDPRRVCWLLSVHYAERMVGPVRIADPCCGTREQWDRVCETVRFSLRRIDCKQCCAPAECGLTCGCASGPCCAQNEATGTGPVARGGCECLCQYLSGLVDAGAGDLVEIDDPCACLRVDLCHGVPLACVGLRAGPCEGEWDFDSWIDSCGPRRLVKSNDVLFDLLRGCDLTHISAIGWAEWYHAPDGVGWEAFLASFGELEGGRIEAMRTTHDRREAFPVVTARYWVEFSHPVRQDSVRADCFAMTVLSGEPEGGWTATYRVPILAVQTAAAPGTPAGLATRAVMVVDARWLYDAVRGPRTIFDQAAATVEIEIRGDLIVDCNGLAVDANARGRQAVPTGNGTPGGTFFSSFQVQPRYVAPRGTVGGPGRSEGDAS